MKPTAKVLPMPRQLTNMAEAEATIQDNDPQQENRFSSESEQDDDDETRSNLFSSEAEQDAEDDDETRSARSRSPLTTSSEDEDLIHPGLPDEQYLFPVLQQQLAMQNVRTFQFQ